MKILPLLLILLITVQTINAAVLEIDLSYGIGFPDFSFNSVPIAFSVYPWKYIGFSSGLEYSMRKKTNEYENIEGSKELNDDGDNFTLEYSFREYKEELSTQLLQIPILLKFRSDYFYLGTGVKIGIPQNVKTSVSYKGLKTTGKLSDWDFTADSIPEFGFFPDSSSSYEARIKAKPLLMLAAESGARLKLGKNFALLFGVFADYSINKGFSRNSPSKVEWIENLNKDGASIKVNDGWEEWRPWSVGGVVKLSFIFGGKG